MLRLTNTYGLDWVLREDNIWRCIQRGDDKEDAEDIVQEVPGDGLQKDIPCDNVFWEPCGYRISQIHELRRAVDPQNGLRKALRIGGVTLLQRLRRHARGKPTYDKVWDTPCHVVRKGRLEACARG